jgi:hypothetical protein
MGLRAKRFSCLRHIRVVLESTAVVTTPFPRLSISLLPILLCLVTAAAFILRARTLVRSLIIKSEIQNQVNLPPNWRTTSPW